MYVRAPGQPCRAHLGGHHATGRFGRDEQAEFVGILVGGDPSKLIGMHDDKGIERDLWINRSWRAGLDEVEQRLLFALAVRWAGRGRREYHSRLAHARLVSCRVRFEFAGRALPRERGVAAGYQGVTERDVMATRDLDARAHQQLVHAGGRWPDPAGAATALALAHC